MPLPEKKRRGRPPKDRGFGSDLGGSGYASGKGPKKVRFIEGYYDKKGDGEGEDYRDDDDGKDEKEEERLRKNLEECDDYVDVSKID